ncbi:MAG: retroviral-like aspartic protease family protein [Anaerolineae bacterium]
MSHRYLDDFYPAMPALVLRLGYPGEGMAVGPITALVDTGADGTLIPQPLLDEIGAPLVDSKRIRSHWGEWRQVLVFAVDMGINDLRLPAIEVVGDELGSEIIVGRNVLNRLRLLLDGPRREVQVVG